MADGDLFAAFGGDVAATHGAGSSQGQSQGARAGIRKRLRMSDHVPYKCLRIDGPSRASAY